MADAMETLKGILGDDAEGTIKNVMSSLSMGNDSSSNELMANDDMNSDYLLQIREIANKIGNSRSDPRASLLMSLRPYMRKSRQGSIDSAIKLLNLAKIAVLFNK